MIKLPLIVASLVCSAASVASAGQLSTARSSVSGITLTLTDLDPLDGQTPSLQLTDAYGSLLIFSSTPVPQIVALTSPTLYFPASPVSRAIDDGAGTFVQGYISQTELFAFSSAPSPASSFGATSSIVNGVGTFLLSPHTSLTVIANLSYSFSCAAIYVPGQQSCEPSLQSTLSFTSLDADDVKIVYGEADYRLHILASGDYSFSAPFSATAYNSSSEPLAVNLLLASAVSLAVSVPEPASSALWAAGWGVVGWAAKRRRQAARVGQ